MAKNEIDPFVGAEIGQPVPGEHALAADHENIKKQPVPIAPNRPCRLHTLDAERVFVDHSSGT
jgi:hypothetical protein